MDQLGERTVPNQPKTPARVIRIPDDVWVAVGQMADREGTTPSEIVRRAVAAYVAAP